MKEAELSLDEKVGLLGKAYAAGSRSFEENDDAKQDIADINKKIYNREGDVFTLYQKTRQWSLEYFAHIYRRLGSHFDRLYFESEVYESGKSLVLEYEKKGVFEKSDGAIIFPGEKYGLHSRVFLTKEGNPTYEGKEMGLGKLQFQEYDPDLIVHLVGPEQSGYFQVVFKALECIFPYTTGREYHLAYGWVRLKQGKMSSRSGNVVLGEWLIEESKKEIYNILQKSESKYSKKDQDEIAEKAAGAAVKYAFLRVSTKNEIAFDFSQSVSFEGDSGPYLQYAYARCMSVLRKGKADHNTEAVHTLPVGSLNDEERAIARYLMYFPDIIREAAATYAPSLVCSYLFTLSQLFNALYAKHQILGVPESPVRLGLTAAVAQVLKNGLYLLGIEILEKM
jgi:arginyl-tRNA synthetase